MSNMTGEQKTLYDLLAKMAADVRDGRYGHDDYLDGKALEEDMEDITEFIANLPE